MAVYKVIQDVEAEDKLLGPLTFKGFIYAGIALLCGYINFRLLLLGTPIKWVLLPVFLLPMLLFGVLASPLGHEQPTEVWLLSKIRFFLKPRLRIWDQSGIEELVTITVPKKLELRLTKDITQTEVQSRLKTLASTLDTRGWAIKNVALLNTVTTEEAAKPASDRLVANAGYTQAAPVLDIHASDDILDEKNNPTAQKFEAMMKQSESERKSSVLQTLKSLIDDSELDEEREKPKSKKHKKAKKKVNTDTKELPATKAALASIKKETAEERARREAQEQAETERKLSEARQKFSAEFEAGHKKPKPSHQVVGVAGITHKEPVPAIPQPNPVTAAHPGGIGKADPADDGVFHRARQADNMELAQSGSAFSVATLAQLANRPSIAEQTGPDEVTISLH